MHLRLYTSFVVLVLLSACASPTMNEAEKKQAERQAEFDERVDAARSPEEGASESSRSLYFGHNKVEIDDEREVELPAVLDEPIVVSGRSPTSVQAIAEMLSATYDFGMYITPDAQSYLSGAGSGSSGGESASPGDSGAASSVQDEDGGDGGSSGSSGQSARENYSFRLVHDGPVERLLDRVASRANIFWRWDPWQERVVLYRDRTRTFKLSTFAGSMEIENSVQGNPTGGGDGDTSSMQKAAFNNNDVSVFQSVGNTITTLASPDAKIRMSQTPPRITVQDTPYALDRIATYMDGINNDLGKTVLLNVQILRVSDKDGSSQGIDWELNFDNGDVGLTSEGGLFAGSTTPSGVTAQILNASSNFTGTEVFLDALREKNNVSSLTQENAVTLNSMPVPIRVVTERGYVAETSTTLTGDSSSTQIEQEQRMEGVRMSLLPRVMDQETILLQMGLNLSGRLQLDNFTAGDTTVQVPTQDTQDFLQRVSLKAGQTLILSGYDSVFNASSETRGLSGWRDTGDRDGQSTMILVTPHLLDS